MKFFISLNELRTLSEPKLQIQMLEQIGLMNLIDGIEVNANYNDPLEAVRLSEYATLLKQQGKLIQIHTPHGFSQHFNDYDYLSKGIHMYGKLAEKIQQNIIVVIHPVKDDIVEKAQYKTMKLISKLNALKIIYQYDLTFVLENLAHPRLGIDALEPMIKNKETLFCWDIGHSIMNNKKDYQLDKDFSRKLTNVHIHDVHINDHHPFIYGNTDYMAAIHSLVSMNYKGSVVIEMNYNHLKGDSLYEKFEDYLYQVVLLRNAYDTLNSIALLM